MTTRTLSYGLLIAALLVPATAPAERRAKKRQARTVLKTFPVDTRFEEAALRPTGVVCDPGLIGPATFWQTCKTRFQGPSTLTGTLAGEAALDYLLWMEPRKVRYTGVFPFTGRVAGCGTGSFIMEFHDGRAHLDRFKPENQSVPGENAWVVRKGSGTGGLKKLVSGGGDVTFDAYFFRGHDGKKEFANGEFTGSVKCAVRRRNRRR